MPREVHSPDLYPDAIDTRLVLRIYAWIAIGAGILGYLDPEWFFPWLVTHPDLAAVAFGRFGLYRSISAAIAALGFIAVGMSRIDHPIDRGRALYWLAVAHATFGAMFFGQWYAIFDQSIPRIVAWIPLTVGTVLLFIALTCAHAPRLRRPFRSLFDNERYGPVLVERARESSAMAALRSQYEEHIRQAARVEERTRLARDLHDAVKQQLFVIQTAAATAQERFHSDAAGTQWALEQVRGSARDAMTEMRALIEQLQASPLETTGLVAALQQQCEAIELRTGAEVKLETGALPPGNALLPGTQQALFRAAQEALSNVARHARATHVIVRLGLSGDSLELTVRDDGIGFDPMQPQTGMGMRNMKARVCEMSGGFLLKTAPSSGTLVGFSIPCDLRTSRDYAWKALSWAAVLIVMALSVTLGSHWERPWEAIFALIAAVSAARYAAAWRRVRARTEAAA
jgi:signal transduction histidine kinase